MSDRFLYTALVLAGASAIVLFIAVAGFDADTASVLFSMGAVIKLPPYSNPTGLKGATHTIHPTQGATLDLEPASDNDDGARRIYIDDMMRPRVSVMVQVEGKLYRWERSLLAMSLNAFRKLPTQDRAKVLAVLRINDSMGQRTPLWAHEETVSGTLHYNYYLIELGNMCVDRGLRNVNASYVACPDSWTNREIDRLDKNG